ncbi:hypothetical protein E2C01_033761 [Portunus trituberculatus]|uniref:Uncharacterized protein n=1 Tax=Portunus trituberculatus TaxID=210409 RepID=A0A5B7F3J7_PORTR|nr:hypothetical protein [Portunus trituberculatus]
MTPRFPPLRINRAYELMKIGINEIIGRHYDHIRSGGRDGRGGTVGVLRQWVIHAFTSGRSFTENTERWACIQTELC